MERKIGEIFEHNGEWYQCLKRSDCKGCAFRGTECDNIRSVRGICVGSEREDRNPVIFKKLEKFGEPYISSRNKKRYQLYRCFCLPIITKDRRIEIGDANWVGIEIKQTKEDMEENRTINQQFAECEQTINDVVRKCYTENKSMQIKDMKEKYKSEDTPLTRLLGRYVNNLIDYETFEKAVKELYSDKEESKPKLKEFDPEAAKAGKPVCTRDGRKARIICFDKNDTDADH